MGCKPTREGKGKKDAGSRVQIERIWERGNRLKTQRAQSTRKASTGAIESSTKGGSRTPEAGKRKKES